MRCQQITQNHQRCKRSCNHKYCWQHQPQQRGGGRSFINPTIGIWTVYGAPYCGYTQNALKLLKKTKNKHTFIDISSHKTKVYRELKEKYEVDHRSIPIIFDPEGEFIGGYTELSDLLEE